jgi:S-adenosyl methyltransferase
VADEEWLKEATRPVPAARIDTSVPNVARVWNFLTGGRDNFEADRRVARQLVAIAPVVADVAPASRAFLGRVVRYLAGEGGIRQFVDIGPGIPTAGNTHEVAQAVAPESRIVYVDNDPVVLAHARALLRSVPEGVTSYIEADIHDTGKIIAEARDTLDFSQPVAIVMIDLLNFITEDAEVPQILGTLLDAVPSGSYLAIMQPASDIDEALNAARQRWNQVASTPMVLRTRAQVASWFDGLELVAPGVVTLWQWHPEPDGPHRESPIPLYGAVARKPLNPSVRGLRRWPLAGPAGRQDADLQAARFDLLAAVAADEHPV